MVLYIIWAIMFTVIIGITSMYAVLAARLYTTKKSILYTVAVVVFILEWLVVIGLLCD